MISSSTNQQQVNSGNCQGSFKNCKVNEKKVQYTMAVKNLKKLLKPLLKLVKRKKLLHQRQQNQQPICCSHCNHEQEENHKILAEIQQNAYNASLEDMRRDPASFSAAVDNYANEQLEQQLYQELQHPQHQQQQTQQQQQQQQQQMAVMVQRGCHSQQQQSHLEWVMPVGFQTFDSLLPNLRNQQYFIPVHFASTNNGTFFWTTDDALRRCEWQLRAQYDRWGQA